MCRLLAFASPRATTASDAVGPEALAAFAAMTRLHGEGWGTAALTDVGRVRAIKAPTSGARDAAFAAALSALHGRAGLVHLRLASTGMALVHENTHPFTSPDGRLAFAHNGGMTPAALIEPLVAPALRGQVRGTTDSERYFAVVRTHLARGGGAADAVAAAVDELRPLYPLASMNAVLVTPDELVVVHSSSSALVPHADFDASGLAEEDLPADHRTGYFQLWTRRGPDGRVVFSSSGIDTRGWEPVAPETVTRVDLATMEVSSTALAPHEVDVATAVAAVEAAA